MSELPLPPLLADRLGGRVVVLGIGNPLRGDDGVGCEVVRQLRGRRAGARVPRLTVIDAEEVPESYVGLVVAAQPDVVLLVDAVDLGGEPGAIALLEHELLDQAAVATHRTPLGVLARYLTHEAGTRVCLLGIQPSNVAWGAQLTPAVAAAAHDTAVILLEALQRANGDRAAAAPLGPEATP